MRRFLVVTNGAAGGIELHPMKPWLREHPSELPNGYVQESKTSHQLRDVLKGRGWTVNTTEDEVRLLPPDLAMDATTTSVLGESDDEPESPVDVQEQFVFSLESHLRDFIAKNIGTLDVGGKKLKLYAGTGGQTGIEYSTEVGFIDILAVDETGNFYVFELKLAHGPDKAMGQLLRYMGWVKKSLANGKQVNGVIVAKNMGEKLKYASFAVPNVSLLEYEVNFQLKAADLGD